MIDKVVTVSDEHEQPEVSTILDDVNIQTDPQSSLEEFLPQVTCPSEIEIVDQIDSVKSPEIDDSSEKMESCTDSSSLKLIAAMNDFESLIKSSKSQDTIKFDEISQAQPVIVKNSVPELDKANDLIKQVEDIIGQTKSINSISTGKKSKSVSDVFEDSDNETEEKLVINESSKIETVGNEAENTPSTQTIIAENIPSTQPTIKVRDIATICEDKAANVDEDVIIPNPTDLGDISEEDEDAKKVALEDMHKLKSKVSDVVKVSLDRFFKTVDGIETEEDLQNLNGNFSRQFTEDITSSHLENHASLSGITMSKDHKRSIVDQIIFYFEIRKSVNMNLRKYLHPSSPQFVNFSSEMSNQFSRDLLESHRMMFNSLTRLAMTPDNHQWIVNQINYKMSQK